MKIKCSEPFQRYKSIRTAFDIPEFKDFNVITGLNGSGKTHFLQAIEAGRIEIEDVQKEDIKFFDYQDFRMKNEVEVNSTDYGEIRENIALQLWQVCGDSYPQLFPSYEEHKGMNVLELLQKVLNADEKELEMIKQDILEAVEKYGIVGTNPESLDAEIEELKNFKVLDEHSYASLYEQIQASAFT